MDYDALSPTQKEAVAQLQALTDGGDAEVAINLLESAQWDVQRAANLMFEPNSSAPLSISRNSEASSSHVSTPVRVESFSVDDSEQAGLLGGRAPGRQFDRVAPTSNAVNIFLIRPLRILIAIIAVPYTLLRAILRALRIPIPLPAVPPAFSITTLGLGLSSSGFSHRPSSTKDPKIAAERWIQSLEEETGCASFSRSQATEGETSGIASGSSSVLSRRVNDEANARFLPDFFVGGYEVFAKACAKESEPKIGCIVLVSEEHDDVATFKRTTLTDPEFVRLMHDNDFLVWGGDIRDRDAWSAAQKLQATTYPFVAFIALQARRGSGSGSSQSPVLTILSRHQGSSIPAATAPTSARTLVTHLQEHLLPRVIPYLTRVRAQTLDKEAARAAEAREREHDRALRAEQDRAFEESARRDRERIEKKRAERRQAEEDARQQAEAAQRAEEQARRDEEERAAWAATRMAWRRYGRRALLPREPRPGETGRGKTVRVGVRMPDGRRAVRFFGEMDSLTAVYAFVDTLLIPDAPEYAPVGDPATPPDGEELGEQGLLRAMEKVGKKNGEWFGFRLAMAYPRKEIHWEAGKRVGEVEGLSGGQLLVELYDDLKRRVSSDSRRSSNGNENGNDSDEYETESD
ncbi:uncharacterized protein PHACADRAFT_259225 [Phanerochaete carnosa HHB-10118-sp]|uniref:UBX domain-containing protein n=1 Tax=Phanerochaete carnosa (strain HHB-10118-sp) TaxID=650164 RepID=K5W2D9_PHACS|nr:uncharacterized protein PHACADRAFT_259225 [Phanerochaete carnosa HHB-10118-sp]EKM53069.1 hypothetical protein PHACADRAFT_259225 [Phanerochaete carnosa HHB-10118-sp]